MAGQGRSGLARYRAVFLLAKGRGSTVSQFEGPRSLTEYLENETFPRAASFTTLAAEATGTGGEGPAILELAACSERKLIDVGDGRKVSHLFQTIGWVITAEDWALIRRLHLARPRSTLGTVETWRGTAALTRRG
jgi:hypothetical protein